MNVMCWSIVLLEDKHITSNDADHWQQLIDWIKVLHLNRHKIGHFGNVLPRQQQKQTTQEQKQSKAKPEKKHIQNAKSKATHQWASDSGLAVDYETPVVVLAVALLLRPLWKIIDWLTDIISAGHFEFISAL